MSVLLSVVGAGATGLPTVIVCVVAAEQTSGCEKGTSETQIETSIFFFRNHFKMTSIWWILLFFLFSVNLYQTLYSGLFVWRGLTACSPFYKTIVLNFSQTRSEDHSGFSSPLFSPGGGALVEIKSDFSFFFPLISLRIPVTNVVAGRWRSVILTSLLTLQLWD